ESRFFTLTGPGGVGKTRLALHVARSVASDYPDGVVWVELAPLGDPALVLPTIARALALEQASSGDLREAMRAWLHGRRVLLVLDNFEHVLDAAEEIASLLHTCPSVHVLVTSRAPLSIRGEQEYVVPPLELPVAGGGYDHGEARVASAVELFAWYARQKNPAFVITRENAATVATICRRLDGLPLALELAAARIRVLSPAELLARLDRLLPLLVGGSRDLPQRQRTMRAAIDWSHELLGQDEQVLFRRLAVFAGGWMLEAAESLEPEGAGDEVVDRLGTLIDQSLVTVTQEESGTRYGMLEPIRQYALARLEEHGEAEETRQRHAYYYLMLAERALKEIEGRAGQVEWLRRLDREHDNLRAALAWSEQSPDGAELGLRLSSALWRFWEVQGHAGEGGSWLSRALERDAHLPPVLRARALTAAGNLARRRAEHDLAKRYHEESLAIYRQLENRRGIALALNNLGVISRDRGEADRAIHLCEESLVLFRDTGNQHGAAIALISLGMAASQQGEYERARTRYEESLALFRASGDSWHIASVQNYLARLMIRQGDLDAARRVAHESLEIYRATR
ncbi:MAG TPA: tetratricopeptide repeat protein, partial [Longimicrobiaceae bacterium]|nr:tetratricopeptide repeat protein [Longimicrobiaceae bacterium]